MTGTCLILILLFFIPRNKIKNNCEFKTIENNRKITLMDFGFFELTTSLEGDLKKNTPANLVGCKLRGISFGYLWTNNCCKVVPTIIRGKKCYVVWVHGDLELRLLGIKIVKRTHTPSVILPRD